MKCPSCGGDTYHYAGCAVGEHGQIVERGVLFDFDVMNRAYDWHKEFHGDGHYQRVTDQVIEEMSEVIKDIMKHRRGSRSAYDVVGELGDVLICIEFMLRFHGITKDELHMLMHSRATQLAQSLAFELNHRD